MAEKITLISGTANPHLSKSISNYLDKNVCDVSIDRFSDGEIHININENIRGQDVFIIQPTFPPAENILELLILIDACYRASAKRITAVIPYYGYARQDRKDRPRVPISAKLIANLIETSGAHRVLAFELHAAQIQGFFDIQVDNLFATPVFLEYIKKKKLINPVVVSPDVGGIKMGRAFAKKLGADLAIVDKRRMTPDASEVMNIIGDVSGRDIIIFDDIISTAGTITQAAAELKKEGAGRIVAAAAHPVFSGDALERLDKSVIEEVVVTNSIPFSDGDKCGKVKVVDISSLLGEAIMRIHKEESISMLFM
ncbi:ribose-phosphate pyrophosphokinase [bacterium]|nr:ribose-phosphate pyrophosphokinase [bacterium]